MFYFLKVAYADPNGRAKAWVSGRSIAGSVGSNPAREMGVSIMSVVCCQGEVSESGWSLIQRIPTDYGVSERDHKSSTMRTWPLVMLRHGKENLPK